MPIEERDQFTEQDNFQAVDPIHLVSIGLDASSIKDLREFLHSVPMVHLDVVMNAYPSAPEEWDKLTKMQGINICLIDFDRDRGAASSAAASLHEQMPNTTLFAVSSSASPDAIIQAMHSGCNEYLIKPLRQEQLLQAVIRIHVQGRERHPSGEVLVFLGAKGGVGTTTIATHLGAFLPHAGSQRTLLVDLHPTFGDAILYLGLNKQYKYSFRQLVENAERLDAELLQGFVLRHPCGLDFLPAPEAAEAARLLPDGAIGATLDFLRGQYDYVLVDCPPGLSHENEQAIQHSDHVHLIAVSEVAPIRNIVRYNDYFSTQKYAGEIRTILNRHSKKNSISDQEIEKVVRREIFWKVPNQYYQVIVANNEGDPSSRVSSSEVTRSLAKMAEQIVQRPAAAAAAELKGGKGLLTLQGA